MNLHISESLCFHIGRLIKYIIQLYNILWIIWCWRSALIRIHSYLCNVWIRKRKPFSFSLIAGHHIGHCGYLPLPAMCLCILLPQPEHRAGSGSGGLKDFSHRCHLRGFWVAQPMDHSWCASSLRVLHISYLCPLLYQQKLKEDES